ncbi:hypothetical protein EDB84DRAFT_1451966 [Lactarius hengduanensis]|nr:hypothetical protein EDB84DRAFT_1451966 [Lactarius hengduanensis]
MFRCIQRHRSPPVRSLATRYAVMRFSSEKPTERTGKDRWEDVPFDPRPPWVYSTSAGLRLVLIPGILFYAVFFADFGDREHVFMPPRRWLWRQRDAFFTITPEERKLVEATTDNRVHPGSSAREVAVPSDS